MPGSTIVAVSSPPGGATRGVVRLSGPAAGDLVRATLRLDDQAALGGRGLYRGRFRDGRGEQPALLLWMPGPRSSTREDVAELHLPGSPWLLDAALARLVELGAELARPGEFTRRAFENGRIDLLQAEGVLELIAASSEAERRAAAGLLFGGLGRRVGRLRDALEELRALCEASLDFDAQDTVDVPLAQLLELGTRARALLSDALAWEERREPLSGLPRVVLVGAPNAGKSSLFNRLTGDGRALVSDLAGTTRDWLSGVWRVAGSDCRLIDTAGLDEEPSRTEPDRLAQDKALEELARADLRLWVVDPAGPEAGGLDAAARRLAGSTPTLLVWSKLDRGVGPPAARERPPVLASVEVSARSGAGLERLEREAARALGLVASAAPTAGQADARALSLRHRRALSIARDQLEEALELLGGGHPLDLAAGALRLSTEALDGVSGRTTPEDLLDRIFARFCLGK